MRVQFREYNHALSLIYMLRQVAYVYMLMLGQTTCEVNVNVEEE